MTKMSYSTKVRRFRGSRKRIQRIRLTNDEKRFVLLLTVLVLLAMWAGWWLGFHFAG